jgi:hypothetical protein
LIIIEMQPADTDLGYRKGADPVGGENYETNQKKYGMESGDRGLHP